MGSRKTIYGNSFIGSNQMIKGKFEPLETTFFLSIIKNYDCFINIGANIGYYISLAQFYKVSEIHAFEPIESNFSLLELNSKKSNHNNTYLNFKAVSDKNGSSIIYGNSTGASFIEGWSGMDKNYFNTVETIRFDSYSMINNLNDQSKLTLMLIDVEGFEFHVLNGMETTLGKNNIDFIIEICFTEHWPEKNPFFFKTFKLLESHGYFSYCITDNGLLKLDEGNKADNTSIKKFHNFFFSKRDLTWFG